MQIDVDPDSAGAWLLRSEHHSLCTHHKLWEHPSLTNYGICFFQTNLSKSISYFIFQLSGLLYFVAKHLTLSSTANPVDFDFGVHGESDGFDLWRLQIFAGKRLAEFGISSEHELGRLFKEATRTGSLVQSGSTLYYLRNRPFGVS
ncbi:DUF6896 domain-containing protein [Dyella flava]|uniref:DUF6896 domain-containing protein n=1 Tax=Dyella flava TaxID=1920170 RepID=UPI0035E9D35B